MGNKIVKILSAMTTSAKEIASDIMILNFTIVNACLVSNPEASTWVLVDTGLDNSESFILQTVEERFGKGSCPQCIILTHGHFDHVGSVQKLSRLWDVPVYIHELEMPYITGKRDYPVGDPTVDEGLVAKMSPTFPHTSIDISINAVALPSDGNVPGLPHWKWIHTPGHTEGHISLFREKDRVMIAGDSFCTVIQESLISVVSQSEQISGPPKYLTVDWKAAEDSVRRLRDLIPSLTIPSHGQPMKGEELTRHMDYLVSHFDEIAVPDHGRYVNQQP